MKTLEQVLYAPIYVSAQNFYEQIQVIYRDRFILVGI